MHEVGYEEGLKLAEICVCGECGSPVILCWGGNWGIASYVLRCAKDIEHKGLVEEETYTQAHRRGKEVHPAIRGAIERKLMPKDELGRAMNLLALKYPKAIVDPATASLFIIDCARLDLDPLISPAEAVPIPFKSRKKKDHGEEVKVTIQMIITEDGWLSMAARGCPERWAGAPSVEPVTDPKLAESLCGDKDAWLWKATGRTKGMPEGQSSIAYGYFTTREFQLAQERHTPAATQPGNQARVRAIKRWVRENFPDCRQKMMDITSEWYQRAEGIKAAQECIDAEYTFIRLPEGEEEKGAAGARGGKKATAAVSSPTKQEAKTKKSGAPPAAEEEGFHIDLNWLKDSLTELKWTDETMKSFVVSRYGVDGRGTLTEVLGRLTREQAEEFVKEIQERTTKSQIELF